MKTMAELITLNGIFQYEVIGEIQNSIVNLGSHPLTGESLRFNKIDYRIEYLREDGQWNVFISSKELLEVQFIHN